VTHRERVTQEKGHTGKGTAEYGKSLRYEKELQNIDRAFRSHVCVMCEVMYIFRMT